MTRATLNDTAKRAWTTGWIYALIVIIVLLLKATFNVLLLLLAGVLIAIYFRGLAEMICRKTSWNANVCLVISIVGSVLLLAGAIWMTSAKIQAQSEQLASDFPIMVQKAKTDLSRSSLGRRIVEKITDPETARQAQRLAGTFFKSTFGVLGDIYVVLFLGLFFTASPSSYKKGIIAVVPPAHKQEADHLIGDLGATLKKWLKGQIFAMFVVFILTSIGLIIIGVPMWLVLALIAGLLNFIPNFGPLIAMIPAVLVGFLDGPTTALLVACLYIGVQVLESNVITPQIQRRLIEIPPATIIIAQLLMGVLTGGWGLLLATPLIAILIVVIRELWVEKQGASK